MKHKPPYWSHYTYESSLNAFERLLLILFAQAVMWWLVASGRSPLATSHHITA